MSSRRPDTSQAGAGPELTVDDDAPVPGTAARGEGPLAPRADVAPLPESSASVRPAWWRGARGEWYVVGQVVLIALVFLGPRTLDGLSSWPAAISRVSVLAGLALMTAGGCLFLASLVGLGANLTPLPHPKPDGALVQAGPYRFVRHPIYAAVIMLAFGWALVARGWLTLAYAVILLAFLDLKSAREERWLEDKFPDYAAYRERVRKLIPFVY